MKTGSARILFASGVLLLHGGSTNNAVADDCTVQEVDVLVIGAGMAGTAAARKLVDYYQERNLDAASKIAWIEASDYIGGRMKSEYFQDLGYRIEYGANWISGGKGNILLEFANRFGVRYTQQNWGDVVYYQGGQVVSRSRVPSFQSAYNCLDEGGFLGDYDIGDSADDYLAEKCGWTADFTTPLARAVEWYNIDYEFARDAKEVSMLNFPNPTYGYDSQDKDFFIHDQSNYPNKSVHQGGYNKVPYTIANGLEPKYNTRALAIDYSQEHVTVLTESDGGECITYEAKMVIPTFSVGVLLSGDVQWTPDINEKLSYTENVFEMGLYYKFFFQFTRKFWGNRQFINFALEEEHMCNLWQSLDTTGQNFLPGSKILFGTLTTEAILSGKYDFDNEDQLQEKLLEPLVKAFGPLPAVTSFKFYEWGDDQNTYGSYENWKVGGSLDDFAQFVAPMTNSAGDEVVHFAGSATCRRYYGYVHGAYWSGQRAAGAVLNSLYGEDIVITQCDGEPIPGRGQVRYRIAK